MRSLTHFLSIQRLSHVSISSNVARSSYEVAPNFVQKLTKVLSESLPAVHTKFCSEVRFEMETFFAPIVHVYMCVCLCNACAFVCTYVHEYVCAYSSVCVWAGMTCTASSAGQCGRLQGYCFCGWCNQGTVQRPQADQER